MSVQKIVKASGVSFIRKIISFDVLERIDSHADISFLLRDL